MIYQYNQKCLLLSLLLYHKMYKRIKIKQHTQRKKRLFITIVPLIF